ncbi:hypothetical protein EMN47_06820 [Prolixibacteraceae bacterium JC049]|nr:hypothetical protein [Prolixibacteraceae bacterium JC049]
MLVLILSTSVSAQKFKVLEAQNFAHYFEFFNSNDNEHYKQRYPNDKAFSFLKENIPFFNCPDKELEKTYYFRWWTYRKHIRETPTGFVITEFLPDVPWAGKYNTISCPAALHFYEGRWLHDKKFLSDYAKFWFSEGASPRSYSFWAANSILAFGYVHNDKELMKSLLSSLDSNYEAWESSNLTKDGLFWQIDDRDGMEISIGGSGKRPTINSYMAGDAQAITEIAKLTGNELLRRKYSEKSEQLIELINSKLWDEDAEFYKTAALTKEELDPIRGNRRFYTFKNVAQKRNELLDIRELHGYTPWYFNIPTAKQNNAWKFLFSTTGFKAPYGPTSAEQLSPHFAISNKGHSCQWNGPSWPFATSVLLKGMANMLTNYKQDVVTKDDFMDLLITYSNSHRMHKGAQTICWIDENLNPFTGEWHTRSRLVKKNSKPIERGKDYNHSSFCDHVISDMIGIKPSFDNTLGIDPVIPNKFWKWFCLDRVKYHGKFITVIWDEDGAKYGKGSGFSVFVDGILKYNSDKIQKCNVVIE